MKNKLTLSLIYLALSVAMGAFGAHWIKNNTNLEYFEIFKTANTYQFYSSFSLFIFIGLYLFYKNNKILKAFSWFFIGSIIFSFSLYALVLLELKILGAVTPIGGSIMILSLSYVAFLIYKSELEQ
jgi:uncharacterized membrane protein YgdD (TMEM256/DUF423 family)